MALIPLFFLWKLQKRESAWLACLTATYLCISVLLIILMNPSDDRASADLHRVFFTSSHAMIAILIGYGLALTAAYMTANYDRFRRWGFIGGGVALALALFCLLDRTDFFGGLTGFSGMNDTNSNAFVRWILTWVDCIGSMLGWSLHAVARLFDFHPLQAIFSYRNQGLSNGPNQYGLPIYGNLILAALPFVFLVALFVYRKTRAVGSRPRPVSSPCRFTPAFVIGAAANSAIIGSVTGLVTTCSRLLLSQRTAS